MENSAYVILYIFKIAFTTVHSSVAIENNLAVLKRKTTKLKFLLELSLNVILLLYREPQIKNDVKLKFSSVFRCQIKFTSPKFLKNIQSMLGTLLPYKPHPFGHVLL